jgi:hypothetical protein
LVLLLVAVVGPLRAQTLAASTWQAPAGELARQIAGLTGPGAVAFSLHNSSSIAADDLPNIRRALLDALTGLGVTVRAGGDAATTVRVTLSENARGGLWVAEVQQGTEVRVAMTPAALVPALAPVQATPVMLRKTLLAVQAEPILDAEVMALPGDAAGAPHLVVLSPSEIVTYARSKELSDAAPPDAAWHMDQSFKIAHGRPFPRDLRGRLQAGPGGLFAAYLPGVVCTTAVKPPQPPDLPTSILVLSCADSDDPWPLGRRKALYNGSRNYFTGVVIPAPGAPPEPFYSAAELVRTQGEAAVYSEVSGQFVVSDGTTVRPLAGSRDWGSDIAGVRTGCASGAQLLATASGDAAQDSLVAYEVQGRAAVAASAPLPLPGQVMALWPGAAPGEATVVVEQQQPHHYEAYRVSVVCNQ